MPDAVAQHYAVKILPSAERDLNDLEKSTWVRLVPVLEGLGKNPRPYGAVKLSAEEGHRVRVGSYRILYRIDDRMKTVFVYRVKHRREAYRR